MQKIRPVQDEIRGLPATDGAGVKLVRVLGPRTIKSFDPFLMMDAFDSTDSEDYIRGFPWHPHRGIETITYLISGIIAHGDSLGNSGTITGGDCQWMTAGSGIIHQEMPQQAERMWGVQIWLNLSAADKMCPPAYGDITSAKVPVIEKEGAIVRIIGGNYRGTPGAFQGRYLKPLFLDVELQKDKTWTLDTSEKDTVYIYIFSGSIITAEKHSYAEKSALLFGKGEILSLTAGERGLRCIVLAAPPLGEPVAWGGPIVMNSQAELDQAFRELDEGTFIRKQQ